MWIRKSGEEITKLKQGKIEASKSFAKSLVTATAMSLIFTLLYAVRYRGSFPSGVLIVSTPEQDLAKLVIVFSDIYDCIFYSPQVPEEER